MTDQELIDTIKAATDYEENIALRMLLTMAAERIESLTASVYGLYELERQNAELVDALKYCRQKIAYMTTHGEWYSPGSAIEKADAALAKAEGK